MAKRKTSKLASDRRHTSLASLRLIGMIHLPALPGAAMRAQPLERVIESAVGEARILVKAGFDAVIVENFGDAPFAADHVSRETIASMAIVVDRIVRVSSLPVGVNVLRNDALSALAVAAAAHADFIRVNVLSGIYATDQGLITGRAADLLTRRAQIAPHIKIAADVHVKHAVPVNQPDIALAAEETAYRGGADALIVSGAATGSPTDLHAVDRVKKAVPDRPVWIGSGVTAENVGDYLKIADAVIVGTSLKRGGQTTAPLDARRVRTFVKTARA